MTLWAMMPSMMYPACDTEENARKRLMLRWRMAKRLPTVMVRMIRAYSIHSQTWLYMLPNACASTHMNAKAAAPLEITLR